MKRHARAALIGRVAKPLHPIRAAFMAGLERHGWKVEIFTDQPGPHDMLVLWGVRKRILIRQAVQSGREVCVLERGYLGDRKRWTSVSFGGGLNGRGEFRGVRDDASRFRENFNDLMKPWSQRSGYALVIGQVPGDMSLASVGGDLRLWYRQVTRQLMAAGVDVRFRPHPLDKEQGGAGIVDHNVRVLGGTLAEALSGASSCVTFNSNTGVESVLAGVPTVACDEGSMAWPVSTHGLLETLVRPEREQWASALAWKQWTAAEMESGLCWEAVGK